MISGLDLSRVLRIGSWIAAFIAVVIAGGLLFAWSGLYSVAATSGHMAITKALLEFGMENSVRTHSAMIEAPILDDEDLIRLGAGHYQGGCAPCHGAPGSRANPIAKQMLPPPPDLATQVPKWKDRQLFWIVKHGIKYAGMPAWTTQRRDDEVWAVVAFLKQLPEMTPERYTEFAHGNANPNLRSFAPLLSSDAARLGIVTCERCHGNKSTGPTSRLIPKLAGQREAYLALALKDYAAGTRQSGIMEPIAAELDETALKEVAAHYAGLQRPKAGSQQPESGDTKEGQDIARNGDPQNAIPACVSCHGPNAAERYPRLAGQPQRYLALQLELFRSGVRAGTNQAETMAAIAERMSAKQVKQASAYFASLPPFSANSNSEDAALAAPSQQGGEQ